MVVVTKKKGETKDALFRKFTKLVMDEQIADEVKKHQYYLKPSLRIKEEEKQRIKKRAMKRKMLKNVRRV